MTVNFKTVLVVILGLIFSNSGNCMSMKQQSQFPGEKLINNDWATLAEHSTIRYFHSSKYYPDGSEGEIWYNMGESIGCVVNDDLSVQLELPSVFDASKPFKVVTHGFSSKASGSKTAFVNAWMQTLNKEINVILFDWSYLAFAGQVDGWDNVFYDAAARNAIDVGEYFGRCLAKLSVDYKIPGSNIHLLGHSLGAHLMGKAGRIFTEMTGGDVIARVTGFDPAGPRFVDGPVMGYLPELHENRLNTSSAEFVDVIHSNGGLEPAVVWFEPHCGDLHQMGHRDFYPDGGSAQEGCGLGGPDALPFGACSHRRSYFYYLHAIWEPELLPVMACATVEDCNQEIVSSQQIVGYMGENAQDIPSEYPLLYTDITDSHWDEITHN